MAPEHKRSTGETISFVAGLMAGFIFSAPIAAWMSPRSGRETRDGIRQQGRIIRRKASDVLAKPAEQIQARVGQLRGDSVEDALEEGKSIAAHRAQAQSGDGHAG
jgi:gas vesicle protein